ncbi:TonB-dependent receptor [Caulobacter sp. D4A]|uniref:TonB-dependent receptor n=1 Tax=unclassified Caulobacter TaxID=2648921 RepID=UPI000D73BE56|nr:MULTISPECIES: TonB-dependent receptor [unclassified Caulobacter]PXA86799.1 TonB-dependent receptor [Caulobacter sp. D4A]PXA93367.1 TonB-dependent receptor [Caulobacter sp. D5]
MTRQTMLLAAASGLSLLAVSSAAWAQDTAVSDTQVEEVVVTGVRKSLRDALDVKQGSDKVVEAISAKDIGVLPDVTIAESIARLPGVNATRDRGNDSQAVVRGLGARLVLGTVNNREVASTEPDRNVRWEIYPSEVVSGVQVYKSQSADLIAGGVAATINISTLDPLDYKGPSVVLRAGPVFYDGGKDIPNYNTTGYRASGSFVQKINDDLAIVIGLTNQRQKNGYGSFTGWGYNDSAARPPAGASDYSSDVDHDGDLDATPWGAQMSASRIDQKRTGVSGGLQWKPTDNFELKADALYSKIKITEVQDQTVWGANNWGNWNTGTGNIGWHDGTYNATGASYTIVNNTVVAATLPYSSVQTVLAKYSEDKDLFAGGLNGKWTGDQWTVAGDVSYSKAKRTNTWKAVRFEAWPEWTSFDWRAGRTPTITTSQDSLSLSQTADLAGSYDGPEHLRDELKAAALDFTRDFGDGVFKSVQFGARISDRTKDHNSYSFAPTATGATIPASLLTSYKLSGGANVPALLTGDIDKIAAIAYGAGAFNIANATEELAERWSVNEKVYEGYGKLNFAADAFAGSWLTGNVGVRVVHTETSSDGMQQQTDNSYTAVTVDNDYTDVLPSANLKFDFQEGRIFRLGLSKVIARPPLDELRASRTLANWAPWTGSAGNPNLKPFEALQLDASFEYYFRPEALAAISYYYKDVDSYIGWKQSAVTYGGQTYAVSSPVNGGSGYIQGVEFTFQTPFFFLPKGFDKFGIYSNYAYVDSDLHEFSPVNNPLSLTGLAKNTATIDLWYANGPLEARLGWKYHSPMTVIYGWSGSDLQTLDTEKTLDFSSSYQINEMVGVRFQVNNLTNQELRMYRDNDPNRIGRYDSYGRRYLVDVTLKF